MKVEKAEVEGGYYIICTEEEFEKLKPFLNKYNPNFLGEHNVEKNHSSNRKVKENVSDA